MGNVMLVSKEEFVSARDEGFAGRGLEGNLKYVALRCGRDPRRRYSEVVLELYGKPIAYQALYDEKRDRVFLRRVGATQWLRVKEFHGCYLRFGGCWQMANEIKARRKTRTGEGHWVSAWQRICQYDVPMAKSILVGRGFDWKERGDGTKERWQGVVTGVMKGLVSGMWELRSEQRASLDK